MYRPFMDDPGHIALLDGQRYVVLRANGVVRDAYVKLQSTIKERLAGRNVSYPAQPHVTLLGVAQGTAVAAVRTLVTSWARSVPPLRLEVERATVFPAPFQIAVVQVRRTPELAQAMSSLREQARQRGLPDLAEVAPDDWVFHMSLAYCSALSQGEWTEVGPWLDELRAPAADTLVSEAEIVVFDHCEETSGGTVPLAGSMARGDERRLATD